MSKTKNDLFALDSLRAYALSLCCQDVSAMFRCRLQRLVGFSGRRKLLLVEEESLDSSKNA